LSHSTVIDSERQRTASSSEFKMLSNGRSMHSRSCGGPDLTGAAGPGGKPRDSLTKKKLKRESLGESREHERIRAPPRMESLLNSVLPHWPGVMFRQRADLTFEFAVGRLEELTGRSREQWEREPGLFWGLVHELDREEFRRQLARVGGSESGLEHSFRIRHATTGRVRHVCEFRRAVR